MQTNICFTILIILYVFCKLHGCYNYMNFNNQLKYKLLQLCYFNFF